MLWPIKELIKEFYNVLHLRVSCERMGGVLHIKIHTSYTQGGSYQRITTLLQFLPTRVVSCLVRYPLLDIPIAALSSAPAHCHQFTDIIQWQYCCDTGWHHHQGSHVSHVASHSHLEHWSCPCSLYISSNIIVTIFQLWVNKHLCFSYRHMPSNFHERWHS